MRIAIAGFAFTVTTQGKLVVEITMRVEVQDRRRLCSSGKAAKYRVGNRVIAAQQEGPMTAGDDVTNSLFDDRAGPRGVLWKVDVAGVFDDTWCREIVPSLVLRVAGGHPQRLADGSWRFGCATLKRRGGVPRHAEKRDYVHGGYKGGAALWRPQGRR
jgi:hypothetical protein